MNLNQLIDALMRNPRLDYETELDRAVVFDVVGAACDEIRSAVSAGEDVALPGLGTFTSKVRPERKGRNPNTQEPIQIPAKIVPVFKPWGQFKALVAERGGAE